MRPIAALLGSAVVLATLVVEAKAFVACSSGLLDLSNLPDMHRACWTCRA